MKNVFLIICLFTSVKALTQSFEGRIIYRADYGTPNSKKIPSEFINSLMGTKKETYIKGGRYFSKFDGMIEFEQYDNISNTFSYKANGSNTVNKIDARFNDDSILSYSIKKKSGFTILNINCDELTINTKMGLIKVYYNKKYKIKPKLYKNHNLSFLNFIYSKTKSIPLKWIVTKNGTTLTYTAIEIFREAVSDDFLKQL